MRSIATTIASAVTALVGLSGCGADAPDRTVEQSPDVSASTYAADMVRCLTDLGWHVVATSDTSYVTPDGIPDAQFDLFARDEQQCSIDTGHNAPPPTLSQTEIEEQYDRLVEVARCIEQLGYAVPPPPSKKLFVEEGLATQFPPWHPYEALRALDSLAEMEAARAECPVEAS